jgi:hypothetical protein
MSDLRLAPTSKYFGIGGTDDYVVLDAIRVIGRILHNVETKVRPTPV